MAKSSLHLSYIMLSVFFLLIGYWLGHNSSAIGKNFAGELNLKIDDAQLVIPQMQSSTPVAQDFSPRDLPLAKLANSTDLAEISDNLKDVDLDGDEDNVSDADLNSIIELFSTLGLSHYLSETGELYDNTSAKRSAEYKLIYGEFSPDERMELLISYLNTFDGIATAEFFPELLGAAKLMEEEEQVNIIRLVSDSFHEELPEDAPDYHRNKWTGLLELANNGSPALRETLLISIVSAPNASAEIENLFAQYKNDPSDRVRAITTLAEQYIAESKVSK